MSDYLLAHGTRATPQSEPIPGKTMLENEAGGYTFEVTDWQKLNRFLILGTEGGDYYVGERAATMHMVDALRGCIAEDGVRTVGAIVAISEGGLAPQNESCLYALAACISLGDKVTRSAAAEALPAVARTSTMLYHFVSYAEAMRGWGRTLRWAVSNWYEQPVGKLAYQAVKYRQRDGWSHRDLLRLAHPSSDESHNVLYDWIVRGDESEYAQVGVQENIIWGFTQAQNAKNPSETAKLITQYRLPREAVNPEHLTDPVVWRALLDVGMPIHAMTRNLANMTRYGILTGSYLDLVVDTLTDDSSIHRSRLHPMTLLVALRTYASGRGLRGQNAWAPLPKVVDALDEAFYLAFDNVVPSGKRIVLAVDVSASMNGGQVAGAPLSPREAAVAMALVTLHAEPNVDVIGFTTRAYKGVSISRRQRLDDAIKGFPLTGEGTDCAIPVMYARDHALENTDAIVMYTDSQSWAGRSHVTQVMQEYRNQRGLDTRLVVCAMVANRHSVADPSDLLSLNVAGFDTSTPGVIGEFVAGRV